MQKFSTLSDLQYMVCATIRFQGIYFDAAVKSMKTVKLIVPSYMVSHIMSSGIDIANTYSAKHNNLGHLLARVHPYIYYELLLLGIA